MMFSQTMIELQQQLRDDREQTLNRLDHLRKMFALRVERDEESGAELLERSVTAGKIRELEEKVKRMDQALIKMAEGTYGICEGCGAEIDPTRLEAVPDTTFCLACKQAGEQRVRHQGQA